MRFANILATLLLGRLGPQQSLECRVAEPYASWVYGCSLVINQYISEKSPLILLSFSSLVASFLGIFKDYYMGKESVQSVIICNATHTYFF